MNVKLNIVKGIENTEYPKQLIFLYDTSGFHYYQVIKLVKSNKFTAIYANDQIEVGMNFRNYCGVVHYTKNLTLPDAHKITQSKFNRIKCYTCENPDYDYVVEEFNKEIRNEIEKRKNETKAKNLEIQKNINEAYQKYFPMWNNTPLQWKDNFFEYRVLNIERGCIIIHIGKDPYDNIETRYVAGISFRLDNNMNFGQCYTSSFPTYEEALANAFYRVKDLDN